MKIKADYANAPQWKETTIKSSLPKELKCLDEIAHNMWWAKVKKKKLKKLSNKWLRLLTS